MVQKYGPIVPKCGNTNIYVLEKIKFCDSYGDKATGL